MDGIHRHDPALRLVSNYLIPQISIWPKLAILCVFGGIVLFVRIFHEKAGIEVTGSYQRGKRPRNR